MKLDGDCLELQYRRTLEAQGKLGGKLGTIFRKPQNKIQDPAKLERLIKMIEKEQWSTLPADVKVGAGQGFTPRPLTQTIVEVMQLKPTDTVADPACGIGGLPP